jgi:hypothetical protein
VACGETIHAESAPPFVTNALTSTADTTATTVSLQPAPPTSADPAVAAAQLEVVDGKFLGIGTGSSLADALRTFGVSPVVENTDQPFPFTTPALDIGACLPQSQQRWVIKAEALTMIFEGRTADRAVLTTWMYTGGPAVGFTRFVVSGGLAIDGTRQDLLARYPHAVDRGAAIDSGETVDLWFGLHGDSIAWFGRNDCANLQ